MPNKKPKREVVLEEAIGMFNTLVVKRDYESARKYFNRQPELVGMSIMYDKDRWYRVLNCSKL